MKPTSLGAFALLTCGAFLVSCASKPKYVFLGFSSSGFFMELPIQLIGPPAKEFRLAMLDPNDFRRVNGDGFIPKSADKILVAEDGYLAGLYQAVDVSSNLDNLSMSPDGQWSAQRRKAVQDGSEVEILDVGRIGYAKRNAWPIGSFKTALWSPDSKTVALNEERPSGRQNAFLLPLDTYELQQIELNVAGLSPFFSENQLAEAASSKVRRWVTGTLLIVWVFGPQNPSESVAEWGYEVIYDRTQATSPNARILRAFVCE